MAEYNFGDVFARVLETEKDRVSREKEAEVARQVQLLQLKTQVKENSLGRELQTKLQQESLASNKELAQIREIGDDKRLEKSIESNKDLTQMQIDSAQSIADKNLAAQETRYKIQDAQHKKAMDLQYLTLRANLYREGLSLSDDGKKIIFPSGDSKDVDLAQFAELTQFDEENFESQFERVDTKIKKELDIPNTFLDKVGSVTKSKDVVTNFANLIEGDKKQTKAYGEKIYEYANKEVEKAAKTLESINGIMGKTPTEDQQKVAMMLLGAYGAKYMDSQEVRNEEGEVVQDAQNRYLTNLVQKLNQAGVNREAIKKLENKINTTALLYNTTAIRTGLNTQPANSPYPFFKQPGTINATR